MDSKNCEKCGKPLLMLNHVETGKPNPVERDPHANGNLAIHRERGLYRLATENDKEIAKNHNKNLYISHFANCPGAKDFRKQKEK
jgi:hypothetical protein